MWVLLLRVMGSHRKDLNNRAPCSLAFETITQINLLISPSLLNEGHLAHVRIPGQPMRLLWPLLFCVDPTTGCQGQSLSTTSCLCYPGKVPLCIWASLFFQNTGHKGGKRNCTEEGPDKHRFSQGSRSAPTRAVMVMARTLVMM